MTTRLQKLDLMDFTGGLSIRRHDFNLGPTESPEMLNVEVDPRGGFQTRRGWRRWNAADIGDPADWDPRNIEVAPLSTGLLQVYVASNNDIFAAGDDAVFGSLSIPCSASPHLADFSLWGDVTYIACGHQDASYKRDGVNAPAPLADASLAFNNDYTTPVRGTMPQAEHMEPHAGYVFVAYTKEGAGNEVHRNRIRWSHPNEPEDWAEKDRLDIEIGGGEITGLRSFNDHLLIFKTDGLWALYGYDLDSWQLIKKSRSVGAPSPSAIGRSPAAVFFYSASGRSGIYAYNGGPEPIHLTERLSPAMEEITAFADVWVGWVSRRLWCCLPWTPDNEVGDASVFIFDPEVGQGGSWVRHRPQFGELRCVAERSDIETRKPLAAISGYAGEACLVELGALTRAEDEIVAGVPDSFPAHYTTHWMHTDWPDRRKSWRRMRFVHRRPEEEVAVRFDAYHNYNNKAITRSGTGMLDIEGTVFWKELGAADPPGFDWGDGSLWGTAADGAALGRIAQGLGVSRSLQLKVSSDPSTPGKAWGFDALLFKFVHRRFTT